MNNTLVRIALYQIATIVVLVLFTGLILKIRFGGGTHYPILATDVRDHGIWMFLIPLVWSVWGVFVINNPKADPGNFGWVFLIGVVLLAGLALVGLAAFSSAVCYHSLPLPIEAAP